MTREANLSNRITSNEIKTGCWHQGVVLVFIEVFTVFASAQAIPFSVFSLSLLSSWIWTLTVTILHFRVMLFLKLFYFCRQNFSPRLHCHFCCPYVVRHHLKIRLLRNFCFNRITPCKIDGYSSNFRRANSGDCSF